MRDWVKSERTKVNIGSSSFYGLPYPKQAKPAQWAFKPA